MTSTVAKKGVGTDLRVGEALVLRARHGTGEITVLLAAKEVDRFFDGLPVDSLEINLTLERRTGQRARVQVVADDSVRVIRHP